MRLRVEKNNFQYPPNEQKSKKKGKNVKIIVKIFCECGGIFAPDPNPFLIMSIKMFNKNCIMSFSMNSREEKVRGNCVTN